MPFYPAADEDVHPVPVNAQPPGGVDQAGQVVDHLAGILAVWMAPVAGLEADGVDARHHPAHLLLPRQARSRPCPAELADLPGRVSLASVNWDKAQLGGFVQALRNQVEPSTPRWRPANRAL